jgi:pimeloyl-ACP methyl ester carboxylesterase
MPSCQVNGVELCYEERGQGEPVIFLNGLSGDHLYWRSQLRMFAKTYRCLAVDNRDVGQSSYAVTPYRVQDLAADVAGLFTALRLPPARVVGLSMGGMIAQELALARPDLVHSLVLVSTLGRADEWFCATLRAFEAIRRHVADTPAFFETILPWWVSHRFLEQSERAAWLRWMLRQNPHPQRLDGFLRQLAAMQAFDALDRLGQISCPVLILAGEDDSVAPPRFARQLHERLPRADLLILPGVGHAPPIEDSGQFNAQLARFFGWKVES